MSWQIEWSPRALRDLRRLDQQTAQRVATALARFAETGHGDVRRLIGYEEEYRLRVGDVRARFSRERDSKVLVILRVLPRGRAYRGDD